MKKLTGYLLIVLAAFAITSPAGAASIDIAPLTATYIGRTGEGLTIGPFTNSLGPFVGKIDHLQSGRPDLAVESRGIFQFDLGSLAVPVYSATFSFLASDPAIGISGCFDIRFECPAITSLDIFGFADIHTTGLHHYYAGDKLADIDPLPAFPSLITIDVIDFIQSVIATNNRFAGFNLRADSFNGGLRTSNGLLQINGTVPLPEPGSLGLLLIGLSGLTFGRLARNRRSS